MVAQWVCSLVDEYGLHIIENGRVPLQSSENIIAYSWCDGHSTNTKLLQGEE